MLVTFGFAYDEVGAAPDIIVFYGGLALVAAVLAMLLRSRRSGVARTAQVFSGLSAAFFVFVLVSSIADDEELGPLPVVVPVIAVLSLAVIILLAGGSIRPRLS